jgi:hypothetical protein
MSIGKVVGQGKILWVEPPSDCKPMVRQMDTTRHLNGFFLDILRQIVKLAARPAD